MSKSDFSCLFNAINTKLWTTVIIDSSRRADIFIHLLLGKTSFISFVVMLFLLLNPPPISTVTRKRRYVPAPNFRRWTVGASDDDRTLQVLNICDEWTNSYTQWTMVGRKWSYRNWHHGNTTKKFKKIGNDNTTKTKEAQKNNNIF